MKKLIAYLLLICLVYVSCEKKVEQPVPAIPQISSFSPASGTTGTTITITGTNLTGATDVSFGGTAAASFTVINATTIAAKVGTGATGAIKVATPTGSASLSGFTFSVLSPVIKSFSPTSGQTGTEITIVGENFTGATAVTFGDVAAASFTVVSATTITAKIGTGATGDVKVVSPTGAASLAGFTYVTPAPTITSVSQKTGTTNSVIILTGTNFTGATAVTFGGVAASSFTVVSATTINAVVGTGGSGAIVVSTPNGNATLTGFDYATPTVTACQIQDAFRTPVVIGFSRRLYRAPSTGTVKVGVLFVDFNDAVATKTPKEIYDAYISPVAEDYLKTVSYGNQTVEFDPTFQWFRMSKPANSYPFSTYASHKAYIQEAVSLADSKVDFSKYTELLIINDPSNSPSANGPAFVSNHPANGIPVDGIVLNNAATSGRDLAFWTKGLWFCHEFGHNMGLIDLYTYSGVNMRFIGDYSIMGNIGGTAPELLGWERWILGWLKDNQVVCQGTVGNGSVTLTPIETTGGVKLLTIPIDATSTIVVESRRRVGYDKNLTKEGPLVYIVDASIASGNGAIKILPIDETDTRKLQAIMNVNQTLTYKNISVTFTSRSNNGDLITFEKK